MNLWTNTFAFVWYNDAEIFHFTQEDFDKKGRQLHKDGIRIVITFSCTHFRWSFRPYWDQINAALKRLVDACHKYDIKVVEHHSSHLTFGPRNEDDRKYMVHTLKVRGSSLDAWDSIRDYVCTDPIINGKPISSFRQIDGSTGTWVRSGYFGWSMCFNNPDYVKAYFDYLETVYATGVDGIMTDDVQYNTNACTCEHCRRLFKEETGYEIPDPAHWDEFNENYDNPAFVAWRRFRLASGERFQKKVTAHYESLGLHMLRPNYGVRCFVPNRTAYPFETIAEMWDYLFQENDSNYIIGPSHLVFTNDAHVLHAVSRQSGKPSMSMYYPRNASAVYLSWTLARSVGQMYLSSGKGMDITAWETQYRLFEQRHETAYTCPKKSADLAFYFSDETRDYTKNGVTCTARLASRLQSAYVSGIQVDVVFPHDPLDVFCAMPCIMLCQAEMLSDPEIEKLTAYLKQGGRLLIDGACGILKADGTKRDYDVPTALAKVGDVILVPERETVLQNHLMLPYKPEGKNTVMTKEDTRPRQREIAAEIIKPHLKTERIRVSAAHTDVCASFFRNDESYVVHFYRADDLTPAEPTEVDETFVYEHFAPGAQPIDEPITVTVERCDDRPINSVMLASPEFEGEIEVPFTDDGKSIRFTVPADTFSGYLLAICK